MPKVSLPPKKTLPGAYSRRGLNKLLLAPNSRFWVGLDFLLIFTLFYGFSFLGKETYLESVQATNALAALIYATVFCVLGLGLGFFERETRHVKLIMLKTAALTWFGALVLSVTIIYLVFFMKVGRLAMGFGSVGSLIGLVLFHQSMAHYLRRFPQRLLILGPKTNVTKALLDLIQHGEHRQVYEHVDSLRELLENSAQDSEQFNDLESLLDAHGVSDVILTSEADQNPMLTRLALRSLQLGVRVSDEVRFFSELARRYPLENLSVSWVLRAGFDSQNPVRNFFKRSFDVMMSALGLLILTPLFLVVALLIKVSSPGPVLFLQQRQGRFSKPFWMIKFRTLRIQGDPATMPLKLVSDGQDPRVTWIGRLLRPLHLDELPQLWNVLIGEMSLVGPRPEALDIVQRVRELVPFYELRHMLRPGITGMAQITQGKTSDGVAEMTQKLSYDLYYLRHCSLTYDLFLILRTVFTLSRRAW